MSGLVTGGDIIRQLKGIIKTDTLIIPHSMLRDNDNIFLDDVTVAEVEEALNVTIIPTYNDGYEFIEKILNEELDFGG